MSVSEESEDDGIRTSVTQRPRTEEVEDVQFFFGGWWRVLPKAEKGQEGERARRQVTLGGLLQRVLPDPACSPLFQMYVCPDQNPNGPVSHGCS